MKNYAKINGIKDGNGNIVITEDSFEMLLNSLDSQKFISYPSQGTMEKETQDAIDYYNSECRKILHQKYVLRTESDGYFLAKRYKNQDNDTEWSGEDVGLVYELFKDTKIIYQEKHDLLPSDGSGEMKGDWFIVEAETRPWLIERPLMYDYQYLTISEDGINNRPWKDEEIIKITKAFNK